MSRFRIESNPDIESATRVAHFADAAYDAYLLAATLYGHGHCFIHIYDDVTGASWTLAKFAALQRNAVEEQ